jgi:hypothetical protein
VEPIHGVTFGLMYATVVCHGNQITPPGMCSTIQSGIATCFGLGEIRSLKILLIIYVNMFFKYSIC